MKKLLLTLVLAATALTVSATEKFIVSENFLRKIVSPDGKTIVLAYGQTHKYVKIVNVGKKPIVELDGQQHRLISFGVSPLGRFWHLNLIYNK